MRRAVLWLDLAWKLALVALLLYASAGRDIAAFEGRALAARVAGYGLALVSVPLLWALASRIAGERIAYPYLLDLLVVAPFLLDVVAGLGEAEGRISRWADLEHFLNWVLLVAAFGQLLRRLPVGPASSAAIAVGFGGVTAILWELLEYAVGIHDRSEGFTAYTNALRDLALALAGSAVAAALTAAAPAVRGGRMRSAPPRSSA